MAFPRVTCGLNVIYIYIDIYRVQNIHNSRGVCLGDLWYKRSVLGQAVFRCKSKYNKIGILLIRIIMSNVFSVGFKRQTLISVSAVHQSFYISIWIIKYCGQFKYIPWNIVVSLIYNVMLLMSNSFLYCDKRKKVPLLPCPQDVTLQNVRQWKQFQWTSKYFLL